MSCLANRFTSVKNLPRFILAGALVLLATVRALAVQDVIISWNPSAMPGVAGYKIYSGATSGNYTSVTDAGNSTNVTISGLADGSTNYYSATTYDASKNESAYSTEVVFVAPQAVVVVTPPPVVTNTPPPATNSTPSGPSSYVPTVYNLIVMTNTAAANSLILSWSADSDEIDAGYQILVGQSSHTYTLTNSINPATSFVATGLFSGTNYFAVREFDASGNLGGLSSEVHWVMPVVVSSAPTNPVVVTNPVVSTPTNSPSTNSLGSKTPVVDPPVTNPVVANVTPVLNAVNNVTLTTNSTDIHAAVLTWDPSGDTGVTGYQVLSGQATGNYTLTQDVGLVSSLVVTGLVSGTTNFFVVREYNDSMNLGGLSSEVQRYVPVPPVLHAVTGLTFTTNATDLGGITLKWTATTDKGVAGYQVLSGQTTGHYTLTQNVGLVTSLAVTGLLAGSTSYYAVRDFDAVTNLGSLSAETHRTVPVPPVMHAVTSLTYTTNAADIHSVTLKWKATTDKGVAGYQVLVGQASGQYTLTQNVALATTSLLISGRVSGTTNFFAVREFDGTKSPGVSSSEIRWYTPFPPPPNVAPTLNTFSNLTININTAQLTVNLAGITSGSPTENQKLIVAAISSNTGLIPNPSTSYTSPRTTGSITLRPAHNKTGTVVITVGVNDGSKTNYLTTHTFTVTIVNENLPVFAKQLAGVRVQKSKPIVLGVTMGGEAPFKYQWKFNGANLAGQTASTLTIASATMANAGAYMVQVSNSAGVTNSATAEVTVFTNTTPIITAPVLPTPGQFSFQVPGQVGVQYVVEATTDFQTWTPVETNTAPFTFTEPNVAGFNQRYYRVGYLPQN